MRLFSWYTILAVTLLVGSAISYITQIYIFNRVEDTFFYMLQDLSFVPVEVLIVTLILDRLLKRREKQTLLNKLNMVIGVFFHDLGNELMGCFSGCTENFEEIGEKLNISTEWKESQFSDIKKNFYIEPGWIKFDSNKLSDLKEYLIDKRSVLLNLLANPNLLEHDTFTDLLWAVFHLADELFHRESFYDLPQTDLDHLKGDLVRAYKLIINEWLSYMNHLKCNYPYLYSIAIRTNPFNQNAEIIVG